MKTRKIGQRRKSMFTEDGAGVSLHRVFYRKDTLDIDPFLLLDTFDSRNPDDYTKGFPMHPHRGIQTFTYMIEGEVEHADSLGNKGTIYSGDYQWMNSGSGIIHEEMPKTVPYMLGFQLWINLPREHKMMHPSYMDGKKEDTPIVENKDKGYTVRVLTGEFEGSSKTGFADFVETEVFDIDLQPGKTITIPIDPEYNAFVSTLLGDITIEGEYLEEKSAATLVDGDEIQITAGENGARIMFFAGRPLNEPVVFGGPFVMNTREEIEEARRELSEGTFIKHRI